MKVKLFVASAIVGLIACSPVSAKIVPNPGPTTYGTKPGLIKPNPGPTTYRPTYVQYGRAV